MASKPLKKFPAAQVKIFKIRNRGGYAAICLNNLTEGKTPAQAFGRLTNPLKRLGFCLHGSVPKPRASV